MDAEAQAELLRIAGLGPAEIGASEENVKQKVVVPLLELLGHRKENLQFEYRTRSGGKIDIFIKDVPHDCKVLVDTKNYDERLDEYVDQIRGYTFDENPLLAVLANGVEMRIYSPLPGVAFEKSLLYVIKRAEFSKEGPWAVLLGLLGAESLSSREVHTKLAEREKEIKKAISDEEELRHQARAELEGIKSDVDAKQEELEQKQKELEKLRAKAVQVEEELHEQIARVWEKLGLPLEGQASTEGIRVEGEQAGRGGKAKKVRLKELVDRGLIRDGESVFLYYQGRGRIGKEQAKVVAAENKLKYGRDGQHYSVSDLAAQLLRKHGVITHKYPVQGPLYWQTEMGKTLNELNEQIRQTRGDRG
ncbi:MAG: hypothetical protein NTX40_11270 [Planctomycetota bacterium]|nr:hypothetical protein [Planctomycetota bacterium]